MRTMTRIAMFITVTMLWAGVSGLAGEPGPSASDALSRFKKLAGDWKGTNTKGDAVEASYTVVSGGTAVMEKLVEKGMGHDMVTVFHDNGDQLMLTHYCAAGNQPRMKAQSIDDDAIRFEMVDITNLATPESGHMRQVVFQFDGDDKLTCEWTWQEAGKDAHVEVIRLERATSGEASHGH